MEKQDAGYTRVTSGGQGEVLPLPGKMERAKIGTKMRRNGTKRRTPRKGAGKKNRE